MKKKKNNRTCPAPLSSTVSDSTSKLFAFLTGEVDDINSCKPTVVYIEGHPFKIKTDSEGVINLIRIKKKNRSSKKTSLDK
jgi:hypothetical protein